MLRIQIEAGEEKKKQYGAGRSYSHMRGFDKDIVFEKDVYDRMCALTQFQFLPVIPGIDGIFQLLSVLFLKRVAAFAGMTFIKLN